MFAYMELIGLEKTLFYAQRLLLENKKDVFDIIRSYRNCKLNIDELYEIEERIEKAEFFNYIEIQKLIDWEMAKNFILKTNLSANDCLHLTVASIVSADYIVTSDREFAEQAKDQPILIKRPEEIMKLLNS
jgi:predicted nucleic acid-binding protein